MAAGEGASGAGPSQVVRRVDMAALEKRFKALADRWRSETRHLSSATRMAMHPAYQQIIGMGPDAVPLILRELERELGHWFWALHSITGGDPVPERSRGNVAQMRAAWLGWARSEGYRW